jgi:hypothetical protein
MFQWGIGYRLLMRRHLTSVVTAPLPGNGSCGRTAEQYGNEKRNAEDGDGRVGGGEMRAGDSAVEAPAGSEPDEEDGPTLPVDEVREDESERGKKEQNEELQRAHGREEDRPGEEEGDVFGPARDHLGGAGVHAGRKSLGRVAEPDDMVALHGPGEGDVLKDLFGDYPVAAEIEIHVSADEQELAVGRGERRRGIRDLFRRIDGGEFRENERHDGVLPEAGDDLPRRVGEQRGFVLLGFVDGAGEVAGLVDGVGVGEEEPGAAGMLRAGPAGVGLAGESATVGEVERGCVEHGHARTVGGGFAGKVAGPVDGVIVDDNDLPLPAQVEASLGLGEEGIEAGRERVRFVAGGDDDGEAEGWGAIGGFGCMCLFAHRFVL